MSAAGFVGFSRQSIDLVITLSYIIFAWRQEMLPLQMHLSVIPRILAHHIGENSKLKCIILVRIAG